MVRATTGGVLRSYRYNLMNSFIASNNARETILTQRNFNSYAEDPASAAKAFRLRMSRLTTKSQFDVCQDTYYKFQSGFSCLQTIDELIDTENGGNQLQTLKSTTLKMLNDPTGDARTQLSKVLSVMSETIVQNMNQKYGDDFIFAGADGHNVPFTIEQVDGKNQLFYRGVPVDAAVPDILQDSNGDFVTVKETGDYLMAGATLVKQDTLPDLEPDNDNPITVVVPSEESGNVYYVKKGAVGKSEQDLVDALFPAGTQVEDLTEDELALLEAEKAKYTETTEFRSPLDDNEPVYYSADDLISKDEYDAAYESLMKDANGALYTVSYDGDDYYVTVGKPGQTISDITISEEDYETAKVDAEKLAYLANEKRFIDIGLGFQENEDGKLIESSAFNEALNGLTFLGYGLDEDGDPKNIYSIVQRLTEIADSVPDGTDWDEDTYNEFYRLVGKLEDASSSFKTQFANMDAGTLKLSNNLDLLEDNFYNLDEQTAYLEDINPVEAINNFLWAEYAYNAALKVGNSILSQSLMDYLQ